MTRKITIYDECDNVIHVESWPHSDNMAMKWVERHYPGLEWTLPDLVISNNNPTAHGVLMPVRNPTIRDNDKL